MNKKFVVIVSALVLSISLTAQSVEFYPSNWFVHMKNKRVQVLIRSINQDFTKASLQVNFPGVKLQAVHHFKNGHYLAADLIIEESAKVGNVNFVINTQGHTLNAIWTLKERRKGLGKNFAQGLGSSDLIYFLMPDRFSNGDPSNDKVSGLKDQSLNRDSIFLRHGGDLKGITNH